MTDCGCSTNTFYGTNIGNNFSGNVDINGDLTADDAFFENVNVADTLTAETIVSVIDIEVEDPLILLGKNNISDALNLGVLEEFSNAGAPKYTGIVRSEIDKKQYILGNLGAKPTPTEDITILPRGTLVAKQLETVNLKSDELDTTNTLNIGANSPAINLSQSGNSTTINGTTNLQEQVTFNSGVDSYSLPTVRGSNLDILSTDASGNVSWTSNTQVLKTLSSGIISGGTLSITFGDDTKFDISDGNGEIINSTTGQKTDVSWVGLTAQSTAYTGILTYVSIDVTGTPVYSPTKPTNEEIRDLIYLGVLVHVNSVNINVVNNQQLTILAAVSQLHDLANAIGFINTSGNVCSPSGVLLRFQKSVGDIFAFGSNFYLNSKDPHITSTPLVDTNGAGEFQYRYSDGTSSSLTLKDIVPSEYDDGNGYSSPGTVGTNKWQTQRIYLFTSNAVKIQPGQAVYNSYSEAQGSINSEAYITEPSIEENGLLIGYLVLRGGATNLSDVGDAVFIRAGKFGGSGSGGGGGSSVHTLQNAYDGGSIVELNSTENSIVVKDALVPIVDTLFRISSNNDLTRYFEVFSNKIYCGLPLNVDSDLIFPSDVAVVLNGNSINSYEMKADAVTYMKIDSTTGNTQMTLGADTVSFDQDIELADDSMIYHGTTSANTPRGVIIKMIANETISAGSPLKVVNASGVARVEVIKAVDTDDTAVIGISFTSATIGTTIDVQVSGIFEVIVENGITINPGNSIEKSDVEDGRVAAFVGSQGTFAVSISAPVTGNVSGTNKVKCLFKKSEIF